MSRDKRKDLRLVKPEPPTESEVDRGTDALRAVLAPEELDAADHEMLLALTLGEDFAELDEEERAAAEKLRRALDEGVRHPLAELAGALRAAQVKGDLAGADHEALLASTLGVEPELPEAVKLEAEALERALAAGGHHPLAELASAARAAAASGELASEDGEVILALGAGVEPEGLQREAVRFREALQQPGGRHPLLPWVSALRAAAGQVGGLDELRHERTIQRALRELPSKRGAVLGAIVAMAAAVALFAGSMSWLGGPAAGPSAGAAAQASELVAARSTQSLFDPLEPFAVEGGESERVSRIVQARAADLRANRFAAWGVR